MVFRYAIRERESRLRRRFQHQPRIVCAEPRAEELRATAYADAAVEGFIACAARAICALCAFTGHRVARRFESIQSGDHRGDRRTRRWVLSPESPLGVRPAWGVASCGYNLWRQVGRRSDGGVNGRKVGHRFFHCARCWHDRKRCILRDCHKPRSVAGRFALRLSVRPNVDRVGLYVLVAWAQAIFRSVQGSEQIAHCTPLA